MLHVLWPSLHASSPSRTPLCATLRARRAHLRGRVLPGPRLLAAQAQLAAPERPLTCAGPALAGAMHTTPETLLVRPLTLLETYWNTTHATETALNDNSHFSADPARSP